MNVDSLKRTAWLFKEKRVMTIVLAAYLGIALLLGAASSTVYASMLVLVISAAIMEKKHVPIAIIAALALLGLFTYAVVIEGITIIALILALVLGWSARAENTIHSVFMALFITAFCLIIFSAITGTADFVPRLIAPILVVSHPIISVWLKDTLTAARYGGY